MVIARGQDAADLLITTVFGSYRLETFTVVTEEVKTNGEIPSGRP
jgi:hypothetical protein